MNDLYLETEKRHLLVFALNLNSRKEEVAAIANTLQILPLELQGCYKGQMERSYLIDLPNDKEEHERLFQKVCELCREHKQESILCIDPERNCKLYFLNLATFQILGHLTPVSPAEALDEKNDAWTRNGNQFYIIK